MNDISSSSAFASTLMNSQSASGTAKLASLSAKAASTEDKRSIDAVSKEFAAVFVTQLLNIMFEGIEVDENFGGGQAEETWRGLMMDEYGKEIANAGGMGLSDMVKAQLLQYQHTAK